MPQKESPQPKPSEARPASFETTSTPDEVHDLRRKVTDLEITNRVKEELLKRAQTQLDQADEERKACIERPIADSRKIGELETHLLQLGAENTRPQFQLPHHSENLRTVPHNAEVHNPEGS